MFTPPVIWVPTDHGQRLFINLQAETDRRHGPLGWAGVLGWAGLMPDASAPRGSRGALGGRKSEPDHAFKVNLPRSKSAPAMLRKMIGTIAPRCQATEVVQLLGTEVVTNALIHAPTEATSEISVTARLNPPLMDVEVTGEGEFRRDHGGGRGTGGYGLALVEALSESWGIRRRDSGITVWFTVDGFPSEG